MAPAAELRRSEIGGQPVHRVGGHRAPARLRGYACPRCAVAVDHAGGVGNSAMQRAVLQYLGVVTIRMDRHIDGLVGWAVAPGVTQPNGSPWEHLDGLAQLQQELLRR